MNAAINSSDVELQIEGNLPRPEVIQREEIEAPQPPRQPEELKFDDQPISLGYRFFSRLFFANVLKIIFNFYSFKGKISMKQCPSVEESEVFSDRRVDFERFIMKIDDEDKESTTYFSAELKCIIYMFGIFKRDILIVFGLLMLEMISRIAVPVIIQVLLENSDSPYKFGLTITLILLLVFGMILRHYNGNYAHEIGLKIRTLIIKMLYAKVEKLHCTTLDKEKYISRIDQHLTRDLQNTEQKFLFLLVTLTMPITLMCATGLLIYWNGYSGLIGLLYFVLMFFVHIAINISVNKHMVAANETAKQKLALLKQTLKGLRIIKISTWQKAFYEMMSLLKDQETYQIFIRYLLIFVERSISLSSPAVTSMIIFLANFYIEKEMNFASSFATLQLLLSIRFNVIYFSQMGISYFYELKNFFTQFRKTLLQRQFTMYNDNEQIVRLIEPSGDNCVVIENTNISCSNKKVVLHNVNLEIKKGWKYTLSGPTGSGKSTFLHFLIRQAHHYYSSRVEIVKSVALVGQQHYLMKDTIRNNILFGKQFNEEYYKKVVYASCLYDDLIKMSVEGQGDQTVLLDGGGNLSGGQKTRIVLARALYQDKQMYLFDNVLADLNSEVVAQILNRVFRGILKDKTVILSTADPSKYTSIMNGHLKIQDNIDEKTIRVQLLETTQTEDNSWFKDFNIQEIQGVNKLPPPNVEEETDPKTYQKYANMWSNWYKWIGVFCLFVSGEIIFSVFVFNLKFLTETTSWNDSWTICLCLAFLLGICYLFKYLSLSGLILSLNKNLFKNMYGRILKCKLNSLQKVSQSQIQERFDGDMKNIDTIMPTFVCDSFEAPLLFINMIVTISIIIWSFVPCGVVAAIGNYILYKVCVRSLSKTRKLDLRTKVPIRSSFHDFYSGAVQIRCYGVQGFYYDKFKSKVIDYYRANLLYGNVQRATAFIIQACTMVASIIGIILIYHVNQDRTTAQDLLYVIALSDYIQFGIRQIALFDGQMMSIQNIFGLEKVQEETTEFYDKTEELVHMEEGCPTVEFKHVHMKYPNGKLALNDVNFLVESGEKIGVIGRTGAGKTSLLNALFRFEDLSQGEILINNVSHSDLPLGRLRNMFGVIPQNPFLFKSTLKKNIDPESRYTEQHVIQVLQSVFRRPFDSESLNKSAESLSSGQKQLITISRCLLNKPKILILDEATSSIDIESTDKFLQMLNTEYQSTTISIAHIIRTVENCKRLIVMDDGKAEVVKVYESYRQLMKDNTD